MPKSRNLDIAWVKLSGLRGSLGGVLGVVCRCCGPGILILVFSGVRSPTAIGWALVLVERRVVKLGV